MHQILGWIAVAAYLAGTGFLLERPLAVFFGLRRGLSAKIAGALLGLTIISWLSGLNAIFFKFSPITMVLIFALSLAAALGLFWWAKYNEFLVEKTEGEAEKKPENVHHSLLQIGLIVAFFAAALGGIYLLSLSVSDAAVFTPWQAISPAYIYLFLVAVAASGALVYLGLSPKYLLPILSVLFFLQHSYLPFTHELLYGADGWRHISAENRLIAGESLPDAEITDQSAATRIIDLVGKFAYSQLWGLSAFISILTSVDLINLNKWLLPVLWSLFVPFILYEIGRSFGWGQRMSLLLVWLGLLPFAWQAGGSFTLPVNFGFVFWLLALLLMLKRSEQPQSGQLFILIGVGIAMLSGYTLFALLFWASFILIEVIRWKMEFTWRQVGLIILLVAIFFPLVEWRFGLGGVSPQTSVYDGAKQFVGSMTGYYFASGPRPHDITAGNIIMNETPLRAYVVNSLNENRWWVFAFSLGFWLIFIFGLYASFVRGYLSLPDLPGNKPINIHRSHYCWLLTIGVGLFLGYIVGRYFLSGEHLLLRRSDSVLALLALLLLLSAVSGLGVLRRSRVLGIAALIIFSISIAVSYSLGPDTESVSRDEYAAMKFVAGEEVDKDKHCVVAGTYPLLALEAVSSGQIVGGGFPISHNFEQPELSKLQMNLNDISIMDAKKALALTGAERCWLVSKTGGPISYYIMSGGFASSTFGGVTVWKFTK